MLIVLGFSFGALILAAMTGAFNTNHGDADDPPVTISVDQPQREEQSKVNKTKSVPRNPPDFGDVQQKPTPEQEAINERERLEVVARRVELERQKKLFFKLVEARFKADEESTLAGKGTGDPLVRANAVTRTWNASWAKSAQNLGLTLAEANRLMKLGRTENWPAPSEPIPHR